eukprot:1143644-Pelagomonas_calceolata.AAC.5
MAHATQSGTHQQAENHTYAQRADGLHRVLGAKQALNSCTRRPMQHTVAHTNRQTPIPMHSVWMWMVFTESWVLKPQPHQKAHATHSGTHQQADTHTYAQRADGLHRILGAKQPHQKAHECLHRLRRRNTDAMLQRLSARTKALPLPPAHRGPRCEHRAKSERSVERLYKKVVCGCSAEAAQCKQVGVASATCAKGTTLKAILKLER